MVFSAWAAFGQGQETRPAYEAASIKLNTSPSANRGLKEDKAEAIFTGVPLKRLIQWAYQVYPFQVSGPGWLEDTYFDISARYPPNLKDQDRPLMLRTLLEDRLKLAAHRESKEMSGYALVVSKGGFKLKPVDPGPPGATSLASIAPGMELQGGFRRSVLIARSAPIGSLADIVTRIWDQRVVDKTGLTGVYSFELRWNNDDHNPTPGGADSFPALFTAIQETLGLRLQSERVPVELIVVDHAERIPTDD